MQETAMTEEALANLSGHVAAIEEVIGLIRPAIQRDGGDIELAAIEGDVVRVRLTGACLHCSLAAQTLGGIRRELSSRLGLPLRVLPAPIE